MLSMGRTLVRESNVERNEYVAAAASGMRLDVHLRVAGGDPTLGLA